MKALLKALAKNTLGRVISFLPRQYLRTVVNRSPARLLHAFNHSGLRDRYLREETLPLEIWDISCDDKGHMTVQGCDCVSLAEQYGTPLYVVNKTRLEKNYRDFSESFSTLYPHVEVAYSYKTNPLPGAIRALHEFGASAEVVSPFELWLALRLGIQPEKIIYNGPGKTADGLKMAVFNNVKVINIDALPEMEIIDALAMQNGCRQRVGIRVVTTVGWKSKFGFSIESGAAFEAFKRLKEFGNLVPCALHFHLGTGISDIRKYLQAVEDTLELSKRIKRELGITIKYFDFGGGFNNVCTVRPYSKLENKLIKANFPVQEEKQMTRPSIGEYADALTQLFFRYYDPGCEDPPTIILEPGRAITSNAQLLLLKVLSIKQPRDGITDVILDGGRSVAAPLEWECHAAFNASRLNASKTDYYSLFGPTCTPYDVLYQIKKLPHLKCDDIIAIMDTGAYFVPMQANFSFPRAPAVMLEDGRHELIRKRETFEDIVANDLPDRE